MTNDGDDTRKLLKVFGVAVTEFQEKSAKLLEQLEEQGGENGTVFSQLLDLVRETNTKWEAVTAHLFAEQQRVLFRAAEILESR